MDIEIATEKLKQLEGEDLRALADSYGITVVNSVTAKINKGWAGLVLERCAGLTNNPSRNPDGGEWELKAVPLRWRGGGWRVKETMAITMINYREVEDTPFWDSHLYLKLRKLIICGREFVDLSESSSRLISVGHFDLHDQIHKELLEQIEEDYELVRLSIKKDLPLSGSMGKWVQPRTKGPGHGSVSRAFYARTKLVEVILNLKT